MTTMDELPLLPCQAPWGDPGGGHLFTTRAVVRDATAEAGMYYAVTETMCAAESRTGTLPVLEYQVRTTL